MLLGSSRSNTVDLMLCLLDIAMVVGFGDVIIIRVTCFVDPQAGNWSVIIILSWFDVCSYCIV